MASAESATDVVSAAELNLRAAALKSMLKSRRESLERKAKAETKKNEALKAARSASLQGNIAVLRAKAESERKRKLAHALLGHKARYAGKHRSALSRTQVGHGRGKSFKASRGGRHRVASMATVIPRNGQHKKQIPFSKEPVQYCASFNRFGICKLRSSSQGCPNIHDRDKVRVCSKFLQGKCTNSKCLLSHRISDRKMPVCYHFLKGICSKANCPYLHVKTADDAEICEAFNRDGFCPLGEKCKLLHVYKRKMKEEVERKPDPESDAEGRRYSSDMATPSSFRKLGMRIIRGKRPPGIGGFVLGN